MTLEFLLGVLSSPIVLVMIAIIEMALMYAIFLLLEPA